MSTRTAIYTRVSTERQADEDKTSLDEQREACHAYTDQHGLDVVAEYQDIGSGASRVRRSFKRMLADAKAGAFSAVVCWKSDRLFRGIGPAADVLEAIEPHDVTLLAVQDSIDRKTLGLWAALAGMEGENIKERMALGKVGAAKAGRVPVGSLPIGYRRGPERLPVVHEEEAEIVRRIFAECIAGRSVAKIAQDLNFDSIPTPSGHRWHKRPVLNILNREAYAGRSEYNGVAVAFPPIVEPAAWDKAQAAIRKRRFERTGQTRHTYTLQSLVECVECGRRFTARTKTKPTKANGLRPIPTRYYECGGSRDGVKCRKTRYVRADRLEELVWGLLEDLLLDPDTMRGAVEKATSPDTLDRDIRQISRDISRVDSETDLLTRSLMRGSIDEDRFDRLAAEQADKLTALREELDSMRRQRQADIDAVAAAESVQEWARQTAGSIRVLDAAGRREVVRAHVEKVRLDGAGTLSVTFRLPVPVACSDSGSRASSPAPCRSGRSA